MDKEIYMVIAVDLNTKTWRIDDDVFMARFNDNEGTYNHDTEEWEDTDWDEYVHATKILAGEE